MKIVFFGTPEFVVPVLDALYKAHEVVGVVTAPDAKAGRKQILDTTPVKKFALKRDIPVFSPAVLDDKTAEELRNLKPDFLVVAAYGQFIPPEVLDIPKVSALNIHPSLLPLYRGPSPLQETILKGDSEAGVTIIEMDWEIDHGPIAAQQKIRLSGNETFLILADKLFGIGTELLLDTIQKPLTLKEQDHKKATFTDLVSKENGFIDMQKPPSPEHIARMIRAYYPWPGVWTKVTLKNKKTRIKLLPNKLVQLEGKNTVSVKEFINGYPELGEKISRLLTA